MLARGKHNDRVAYSWPGVCLIMLTLLSLAHLGAWLASCDQNAKHFLPSFVAVSKYFLLLSP